LLVESPPVFTNVKSWAWLCLFGATATAAHPETIRLKNGRTILADSVRESGERVEYTIGENTFAIRKALVEKIDAGGSPIVSAPVTIDLPSAADSPALRGDAAIQARVISNGRVDTDALAAIENAGLADNSALANYLAADFERTNGKLDAAVRYFERARRFVPENEILAANHAAVLLQLNRYPEALSVAQTAVRLGPTNGNAHMIQAYALYLLGRMKEALASIKKAYDLLPSAQIKELLDKIEREAKAEGEFSEQTSHHFTLRYEGQAAAPLLRKQILDTLEFHFNELVRELDYSPREAIAVILYTDRQFFNVTRAPSWTGALNDGKLRIPVSGLQEVNSDLARTLKHELAHSFINSMTRGRAPTWLHEGVAQLIEPQTSASNGRRLAALYAANRNIPLNELEASFIRFSPEEAQVAYAQSLVSAEYIREAYGMSSLVFLLKRIGDGQSTEASMRSTVHSGYAQFQREITEWLKRTYGE
jgi:tetratricopeptide (TPR) repeat protein